ncbi:MAG: ATP-binding protein [Bacteroidota bacterium]
MLTSLIGRTQEIAILKQALSSSEAEMVSIIGRRRVGKTFLVNTIYEEELIFSITGVQNGTLADQLENFADQISEYAETDLPIQRPDNWLKAFQLLRAYVKEHLDNKKKVIFFDELPWLATQRSGFLQALGYFWNSWAAQQNLVIVICGSAASWMIRKVVNDTGGLHNRITKRIYLEPFTLAETEEYLNSRKIQFNRYQLVQLYMVMGGIPHYLKEIQGGKSATQNIQEICFSQNGLLADEFSRLYSSLFSEATTHIKVIRTLGDSWIGLTRKELVKMGKLSEGGTLTRVLEELVQSGFISAYRPFGRKKKEKLYRLTDPYSLFYLQFIEDKAYEGKDIWQHLSQTQAFKTWSGYAFENICLRHITQIKKAMSIAGIYSLSSSYYRKGSLAQKGVQIDLLIDRKDQVINLFEIKFYTKRIRLSKADADQLREKMWTFEEATKTLKQLFWILISPFGLVENQHSSGLIAQSLTLDDLFLE